jgi:alkylation response protein AidB-like acyl-CoA dehydrogenase
MGHPPVVDIFTRFEVVEILSQADGSTGWCTMLAGGGGSGPLSVEGSVAQEMFGNGQSTVAGAARPSGRAVRTEGGYIVSGRWPFMSGCDYASWIWGASVVYDGDQARLNEAGRPIVVCCYFPVESCKIIDTWTTTGLRGTGSHDVEVSEVFVPDDRIFDFFSPRTDTDSSLEPLKAVPGLGLTVHSAVPIGIARSAIELVLELVESKVGARGTALRREAQLQATIARAEALVGSARAYQLEVLDDICTSLDRGEPPTHAQRAQSRLAITHTHKTCTEAVDMLYQISGGSSVYAKNGLDRKFRDIHTANQHIVADLKTYEFAGRMLMGMDPGEPLF